MAIQVLSGPFIAKDASLSSALNVSAGKIFRIIMPDEWTAAPVSFQISYENTYYYDVYDVLGTEITIPVIQGSIMTFGDHLLNIAYVKFRSGTATRPVIQAADRNFRVVIDTKAALGA